MAKQIRGAGAKPAAAVNNDIRRAGNIALLLRLERQACTQSQAAILKGLGVSQNSTYTWVVDQMNTRWALSTMNTEAHRLLAASHNDDREIYAAFTVPELGCALGCSISYIWRPDNVLTEAEFRAEALINDLRNGSIDVDSVNERLSKIYL